MKILHPDRINAFFSSLEATNDVRLPVILPDGTRSMGKPGDGPIDLGGGALSGKPTAPFFPQEGELFSADDAGYHRPSTPPRPLFVAGFTPRDLAALRFVDRFFADGFRDDVYFRRREVAIVAGVSGYCGPGGILLAPAGGDCDLEFVRDPSVWLVIPYTDAGAAVAAALPDAVSTESLDRLRDAAAGSRFEEEELLRRASELLRRDVVPDTFWEEIGDRCIACTGCNLVCPTCTCFGVEDRRFRDGVQRSRMWDSCQLSGFIREASGHNPLGTEALRTRRRIHHKLAADPERWGEVSCFLCGRCDAVCPTGVGIVSVTREMVERFGGAEQDRQVPSEN
jgi:sulfhydrogenase subunit beta (sulfur reductase)